MSRCGIHSIEMMNSSLISTCEYWIGLMTILHKHTNSCLISSSSASASQGRVAMGTAQVHMRVKMMLWKHLTSTTGEFKSLGLLLAS